MPTRKCPFDGNEMVTLTPKQASDTLVDLLVSPKSSVYALFKGAAAGNSDAQFNRCSICGFFAIFTPQLTYQPRMR